MPTDYKTALVRAVRDAMTTTAFTNLVTERLGRYLPDDADKRAYVDFVGGPITLRREDRLPLAVMFPIADDAAFSVIPASAVVEVVPQSAKTDKCEV